MLNRLWRNTHLALALISVGFLLLATVTGVILAFDPIQKEWAPLSVPGVRSLSVSDLLHNLDGQYETILDVEMLDNDAVKIATIDMDEAKNGDFIIDPFTGKRIGDVPESNSFFQTVTNLHRSLFLKSTGRLLVGITAFLFLLSILTGLLLLWKREGGLRGLFSKTIKTQTDQYLHVVISKWTWLPLLIVAISGVYLSLLRFEVIPEPEMQLLPAQLMEVAQVEMPAADFALFREVPLTKLEKLEFPFSDDAQDPFILHTRHRRWAIHQYSGAVLEAYEDPVVNQISEWNYRLHTGSGSVVWSLVLGGSTAGVLFLIYSGLSIGYQRFRGKPRQLYGADEAEFIVLYGSENGSTRQFATALFRSLLSQKKKAFLEELNGFTDFPRARYILVLTSTYGDGEPPANATSFFDLLSQKNMPDSVQFAVLGFGSKAYPKFGQFALESHRALNDLAQTTPLFDVEIIHNQSQHSFLEWTKKLGQQLSITLPVAQYLKVKVPALHNFTLLDRQVVEVDGQETFLLTLQPQKKTSFQSGDLLDIYPEQDPVKRSYSIARDQAGRILLAIKRHEYGVVSNELYHQKIGATIRGRIVGNEHFQFPAEAPSVTLIGNGTGMGPYLGMIREHPGVPTKLYWGGRSAKAFSLYRRQLERAQAHRTGFTFSAAFSREGNRQYVQELVRRDGEQLAGQLAGGGCIMICGSLAMQRDVLAVLAKAIKTKTGNELEEYVQQGQIKMDCY